jgi:hypothetical protein
MSACRLITNTWPPPSVIECDSRGPANAGAGVGKAKDVRSTISNVARRCDRLARCSGVSRVGWRGLPLPSPSTVQPGGIYRQCWISRLPMCPSASDLPRSSWPSGTAGSHWHDGSRWKGRCGRTDWACGRGRHRRADGPLRTCGAERTRGPQWRDRRDGIRRASRTCGRYRTRWSIRSHRTLRCDGRDRHQWNTGGSRTRRCDWSNWSRRRYWGRRVQRTDRERRRTRTNRLDRADGTQWRDRRDGIRRTARTHGRNGIHRHQWNRGVDWTSWRHRIRGVDWTSWRHRIRGANRAARPRRV